MGFLINPNINAVITEPITTASKYKAGWFTIGKTNKPPCGALNSILKAIENPPEIIAPIMHEGMTLIGSDAANGIAPSVMKESPII